MRIPRIPETDLARIAVRPLEEQRYHLRQLRDFRPPHTLNPFRASVPDIVNLQHEMLGTTPRTPWETIQTSIEKSKEGPDGIARNLAVAQALYQYSTEHDLISFAKPTPKWSVGYGHSVAYWSPFYSIWEDRAAFVHFDPRLTHSLTADARLFAFSLMHQRLRVDDPDFADLELVIVNFGRGKGDNRTVKTYRASGLELYGYDQLNEMIDVTYRLWIEELTHRRDAARRVAGGGNPMGF